jgi:hypothetical protein
VYLGQTVKQNGRATEWQHRILTYSFWQLKYCLAIRLPKTSRVLFITVSYVMNSIYNVIIMDILIIRNNADRFVRIKPREFANKSAEEDI